MISVELLPAAHGDSIWIEYGSTRQLHRILIDGGPAPTYQAGLRQRITALPEKRCAFELMVVTHIDADHIDGALIALQERAALNLSIHDLWFNGWAQISDEQTIPATYAPMQGEFLGAVVSADADIRSVWNRSFTHKAVVVRDDEPLPDVTLADGARLTLLGPTQAELRKLRAQWTRAIRDFSPGDENEALRRLRERREYRPPTPPGAFAAPQYGDDRSPANGSSISFLFEYAGVSILFAADAHARTLATTLKRLAEQRAIPRIHLDAVKLPHHGSMSNISQNWLQFIDCDQWLISTNGDVFDHPDVDTAKLIARNASKPPTMLCNYQSESTQRLEAAGRIGDAKWNTVFPENDSRGPVGGLRLVWPDNAPARRRSTNDRSGNTSDAKSNRARRPRSARGTGKTRGSR